MSTKFLTLSALASAVLLAGCTSPSLMKEIKHIDGQVPTHAAPDVMKVSKDAYGTPAHVAQRAGDIRSPKLVRRSNAPWLGGLKTVARTEDKLPAVFAKNFEFNFSDRSSIHVVAERLTAMTGVPVRVHNDVFMAAPPQPKEEDAKEVKPAFPTPITGASLDAQTTPQGVTAVSDRTMTDLQVTTIRALDMRYSGRLRDFLDSMTARLNLAWEFRDGAVVIMRLVTESYDVGAFPGKQQYVLNTGASAGGSAGEDGVKMSTTNRIAITQQGDSDIRESIHRAVNEMVSMDIGASVSWADGSGRLVVVASKEAQARIRDFLNKESKALNQMINVTFDVYSVTTNDTDEKGVDWSSVFQSLNQRYGISFKSPSFTSSDGANMGINYISPGATTNTSSIITLLSQYGHTAKLRPVSITTLNGQWDTKSRLSTDGYLKETTPGTASSSGAAGAPGLKTDTITTGDQYAALPYIQSDKSIMLKYSISLSDLLGLYEVSTGSGETFQKVQTPRVDSINASSTIRLQPGETAVITGLSRLVSSQDENRLSREVPVAAGGNVKGSVKREHFMVMVRATPL